MSETSLLDELLDPFARCLDRESAQRVVEFRISDALQERAGVLAEKANEGLLTEEERSAYEALIDAADLITIIQLKAQRHLNSNVSP